MCTLVIMKKFILACLICSTPFLVFAQNYSGFWKGVLAMSRGCFPVNNIEIQITIKGDSIFGNSYHYSDVDNYVKKKIVGILDPVAHKIFIKESMVTTFKIPIHCKVCIKSYELSYTGLDKQEFLKGDWGSVMIGNYSDCGIGPITLSRIKESAFKEIPEINVDTGQIRLDFYDNGEVDDDSISVKINDNTVLTHQKLGREPITTFVKIDLNNIFQEVEMIAENVGSIPPNTALLVVTAGKKRYELFLTSSAQKSAKVRFVYDK